MDSQEDTNTTVDAGGDTGSAQVIEASPVETRQAAPVPEAASLLMSVKLPIRILLGRAELCLRDVAQLSNGSVVQLDCSPDDPVEVIVNDRVIAHGEVVVVSGNYGVRITRIATRDEKPVLASSPSGDLLNFSERLK
jgi:flagellar motor switch protein FliN